MVTIIDRRNYWVSVNGESVTLQDDGNGPFVHDREPVTQAELEAIPEAEVEAWLASTHLNTLLTKLAEETNRRVDLLIDPAEKAHWMGVEAAFSRQQRLWLEEVTIAYIESRSPDEVTNPPLTTAEKELSASLAAIQKLTAAVRGAAGDIEVSFAGLSSAEILLITLDDIVNHVLWP